MLIAIIATCRYRLQPKRHNQYTVITTVTKTKVDQSNQSYVRAYYQTTSRYASHSQDSRLDKQRKSQSREEQQHFSSFHLGEIIDQLCSQGRNHTANVGGPKPSPARSLLPSLPFPFITIPFPSLSHPPNFHPLFTFPPFRSRSLKFN